MTYKVNYKGLKVKDTYDSLIGREQDTIKYPDRHASQIRDSYELSNLLDGEGFGVLQREKHQMMNYASQLVKEVLLQQTLKDNETLKEQNALQSIKHTRTKIKQITQETQSDAIKQHDVQIGTDEPRIQMRDYTTTSPGTEEPKMQMFDYTTSSPGYT
jgi:hypothetical protein